MNVVKATRHFEDWLTHRTDVVKKDVTLKHTNMKAGVFPLPACHLLPLGPGLARGVS